MDAERSKVAAWVQPETFLLDVEVRDRQHALALIAAAVGTACRLDPAPIARALERREQAAPTALGGGFAIPHARIPGLDRPLTLFLRARAGIAFDAPDDAPVSDFLAIMVPADGDRQEHLQLLALISRLFSDLAFRARLAAAPDVATAAGLFREGAARLGATDER